MNINELYNTAYEHDLNHEPQKFIEFFELNRILIEGQKIEKSNELYDKITRLNCDYAHSLTLRENYSKANENIRKAIDLLEKHPDLPVPDALRLYEDESLFAEVTADFMDDNHQASTGTSALIARHYAFSAVHQSQTGKTQGHSYDLWIATKGPIPTDTGQVMNIQTLDHLIQTHILARFDQRNLSQDPAFSCIPVTDSTLAKVTWETLKPHFQSPPLYRVSVSQQTGAVAVYSG